MRRKPVRERVIEAITTQLMMIQTSNGFNFDLQKIERKRVIPERSDHAPIIYLMFGKGVIDQGYNNVQYREHATMEAWFFLKSLPDGRNSDLEYNLFVSDIIELLSNYQVVDSTHPDPQGRIIDIVDFEHQPFYSSIFDGQVKGKVEFTALFTYLYNNPYKWDLEDTEVTIP